MNNRTAPLTGFLVLVTLALLAGCAGTAEGDSSALDEESIGDSELGATNSCVVEAPNPTFKFSPNGAGYCWVTTTATVVRTGCTQGGTLWGYMHDASYNTLDKGSSYTNAVALYHKTSHEKGRNVCRSIDGSYYQNDRWIKDSGAEICKTVKC